MGATVTNSNSIDGKESKLQIVPLNTMEESLSTGNLLRKLGSELYQKRNHKMLM
jgi:hypothetical protein